MSDKEIDNYFSKNNIEGNRHSYKANGKRIHYVTAGNPDGKVVLFVHGSPGSLSEFIHFLADTALTGKSFVISVDRPGFGHSSFGDGEPSIKVQAESLKPVLEKYRQIGPAILVGHSLGGPVIARMAMEYPELVGGLVLVAPSIDPELEPNEGWFRVPLATPFLKWIQPRSFRASNDEIVGLKEELEAMVPYWKRIECPVIVIQGKKDKLVHQSNAEFAQKMIVNAPVEMMIRDNMNHFILWSNPQLIEEAVLTLLRKNQVAAEAGF
jgi:pimeloyl-ACP methyl ester carboxylesterase